MLESDRAKYWICAGEDLEECGLHDNIRSGRIVCYRTQTRTFVGFRTPSPNYYQLLTSLMLIKINLETVATFAQKRLVYNRITHVQPNVNVLSVRQSISTLRKKNLTHVAT